MTNLLNFNTQLIHFMGNKKHYFKFFLVVLSVLYSASCSVIFPDSSAPKSKNYSIDLPNDDWKKIPVGEDPNSVDALKADLAFENEKNGSIISLNSICRKYEKISLKQLTRNLVLGIKNLKVITEKSLEIDNEIANDTEYSGSVEGIPVYIRTIVLKKNYCTYDLIFVSTFKNKNKNMRTFDRFVASFQTEK